MTAIPRLSSATVESFRADGTRFDLAAPSIDEIDFQAIAGKLSRLARYNGTPEGGSYSVAQHSVMGAQALINEREDELTAALFLLHDAHEALFGDQVRPFVDLLHLMVVEQCGSDAANRVGGILESMKSSWDVAIFTAAGLPIPAAWSRRMKTTVKAMDQRMMMAEVKYLMGSGSKDWLAKRTALPMPRLTGAMKIWGPAQAELAFLDMFKRLRGEARLHGFASANAATTRSF